MTTESSLLKAKVIVPNGDIESFHKGLAKLNKKAAAFGLPPIEVINEKPVDYYVITESEQIKDRTLYSRHLFPVDEWQAHPSGPTPTHVTQTTHFMLQYPIIRYGNWDVIGHLSKVGDNLFAMPFTQDPVDSQSILKYLDCPQGCDHCKTNRNRNSTFILKNAENQELKQIGSTCLQDFTGIDPAAALFMAKLSEYFWGSEGERDEFFSNPKPTAYQTESVITAALLVIENESGAYVSSKKAEMTGQSPTSAGVFEFLEGRLKDPELWSKWQERENDLRACAREIIEWAKNLPCDSLYHHNLSSLLKNPCIPAENRFVGLAVSAVPAYRSTQQQKQAAAESKHLGTPGETVQMTLTHHHTGSSLTRFGMIYFVGMRDEAGNALIWKTSKCLTDISDTENAGRPFIAKFKIKGHSDYKGMAQTEVSHLKFIAWQDRQIESADDSTGPEDDQYAAMRMR